MSDKKLEEIVTCSFAEPVESFGRINYFCSKGGEQDCKYQDSFNWEGDNFYFCKKAQEVLRIKPEVLNSAVFLSVNNPKGNSCLLSTIPNNSVN